MFTIREMEFPPGRGDAVAQKLKFIPAVNDNRLVSQFNVIEYNFNLC